jgi:hypothetical protein
MRHGDQLTVVQFVVDPTHLEMPLIRSMDFVLDPRVTPRARQSQFEIVDEILGRDRGYVPSYPPGAGLTDWARFVGLPWEASRGGKATLFPEFLPTLRTMVRDYQTRAARAAGASVDR